MKQPGYRTSWWTLLIVAGAFIMAAAGASVQNTAIVGEWRFDKGPKAWDASGNGAHGTVVNSEWSPKGRQGNCLRFVKPTAVVDFSGIQRTMRHGHLEMWIEPAELPSSPRLIFVLGSNAGWRYRGLLRADGKTEFGIVDYMQNTQSVVSRGVVKPGVWTKIAVEWDSATSTARILISDKLDAEGEIRILEYIAGFWLGAPVGIEGSSGFQAFKGRIDDVVLTSDSKQ